MVGSAQRGLHVYRVVYSNVHGAAFWDFGVLDDILRVHSPGFIARVNAFSLSWSHDSFEIAQLLSCWLTEVLQSGGELPLSDHSQSVARHHADRPQLMLVCVSGEGDHRLATAWPEEALSDVPKQIRGLAHQLFESLRLFGPPKPEFLHTLAQALHDQPQYIANLNDYRAALRLVRDEIDVAIGRSGEGIW